MTIEMTFQSKVAELGTTLRRQNIPQTSSVLLNFVARHTVQGSRVKFRAKRRDSMHSDSFYHTGHTGKRNNKERQCCMPCVPPNM